MTAVAIRGDITMGDEHRAAAGREPKPMGAAAHVVTALAVVANGMLLIYAAWVALGTVAQGFGAETGMDPLGAAFVTVLFLPALFFVLLPLAIAGAVCLSRAGHARAAIAMMAAWGLNALCVLVTFLELMRP